MLRSLRNTINTKILGGALILVFLSALSFSLFHMSSGMDMAGNSSGCPFMEHGESLCSMSVVDHIGAWQSAFLAVIPPLTLLFALIATVVLLSTSLLPWLRFKLPDQISIVRIKTLRDRTYTFFYKSLQELFSNGILHPKLF